MVCGRKCRTFYQKFFDFLTSRNAFWAKVPMGKVVQNDSFYRFPNKFFGNFFWGNRLVWIGRKNDQCIFCSLKWYLSDGKNFSQQKLTFCCLQNHFCQKFTINQIHAIAKKWGLWFWVFSERFYMTTINKKQHGTGNFIWITTKSAKTFFDFPPSPDPLI